MAPITHRSRIHLLTAYAVDAVLPTRFVGRELDRLTPKHVPFAPAKAGA
jgi:hypothetical protein